MNKIKFKAWYNNSQTWVYFTIGSVFYNNSIEIYDQLCFDGVKLYPFTDCEDSEGVEIYEGDILSYDYFEDYVKKICYRPVVWDDDKLQWAVDASFLKDKSMLEPLCDNITNVAGNVYQNPELLTQKTE